MASSGGELSACVCIFSFLLVAFLLTLYIVGAWQAGGRKERAEEKEEKEGGAPSPSLPSDETDENTPWLYTYGTKLQRRKK